MGELANPVQMLPDKEDFMAQSGAKSARALFLNKRKHASRIEFGRQWANLLSNSLTGHHTVSASLKIRNLQISPCKYIRIDFRETHLCHYQYCYN
jgi:hypothetical protein